MSVFFSIQDFLPVNLFLILPYKLNLSISFSLFTEFIKKIPVYHFVFVLLSQ